MKLEKRCDEILKDESDCTISELHQEIEFTGRDDIALLRKLAQAAYEIGMEDGLQFAKTYLKAE